MGSAAVALALGCAGNAEAATPAEIQALHALPCPAYEVLAAHSRSAEERAAALEGDFELLAGTTSHLVPPLDWHQDPYGNRTWVFRLHSWSWAPALLDSYAEDGDDVALAKMRDLALDWIAKVPRGDDSYDPLAWDDKTTGDRAGVLAYVTRAAACESLLTDAQAGALIDSVRGHGEYLHDPPYYRITNHGLFMDYGLALIAYQLPFLPEAAGWESFAHERYAATLRQELAPPSDIFLEHSSFYHVHVTNLTGAMGRLRPGSGLEAQAERMRAAAGPFVMPGGILAPLGDAAPQPVPEGSWLSASAAAFRGLLADVDAGLGVVKRGGGYLAVTAWFHSRSHRQADDLGFHLRDGGRDVISDSGFFGYEGDDWSRFPRSSRAHSVLTIDGERFPYQRGAYGSGLQAGGRGAGWFALAGVNPLLRQNRVRHRRLFLYRPGVGLIVVDRLRSRRQHLYTRRFQIAPGIRARRAVGGWRLRGPGLHGFLATGPRTHGRSAARGEEDPIAGWAFPAHLERVPRWTLAARTRAADADLVAAIGLRGRLTARVVRSAGSGLTLAVRGPGVGVERLRVRRAGRRLSVSRR